MKEVCKQVYKAVSSVFSTTVSLLSVLFFSSVKAIRCNSKILITPTSHDCLVLGNGPSLSDELSFIENMPDKMDCIVVNMFCLSESFWVLKPKYYLMVDPAFFVPKEERHFQQVDKLLKSINQVNWEMFLCVPHQYVNFKTMKSIKNTNVQIVLLNTTPIDGNKAIRHCLYAKELGMPLCQNVLNAAICFAINRHYRNIYLYGADHSWTKDLRVNDENIVCYGDRHVYNTQLNTILIKHSVSDVLLAFSKMFKSHMLLQEYAIYSGSRIVNCTKGSFIDAYERQNPQQLCRN